MGTARGNEPAAAGTERKDYSVIKERMKDITLFQSVAWQNFHAHKKKKKGRGLH